MKGFSSFIILLINLVTWTVEWYIIVGFNTLRHEKILWISFLAFFTFSALQYFFDCKETSYVPDVKTENDHLGIIVGIGSSVLLSLSIIASLPIISSKTHPILQSRFHWAALASFLWIVFGVFWLTWIETSDERKFSQFLFYIKRIKTAALIHALGWAGTAAIMLISSIKLLILK